MIDKLGLSVFVVTDFEETFIMGHELELADFFEWGGFGGDDPARSVMLKVNPLINRILGTLKEPVQLESHGRYREISSQIEKSMRACNARELHLLQVVRNPSYQKVGIKLAKGEIEQFWVDEKVDPSETSLDDLLASEDFQTVEIIQREGKVKSRKRRLPIKPQRLKLTLDVDE